MQSVVWFLMLYEAINVGKYKDHRTQKIRAVIMQ